MSLWTRPNDRHRKGVAMPSVQAQVAGSGRGVPSGQVCAMPEAALGVGMPSKKFQQKKS